MEQLRASVEAFAARPTDEALVQACCAHLDSVSAADVGARPPRSTLLGSLLRRAPSVQYLRGADTASYSVGVFLLSAGARIPLHNHPGMTVLSRLLFGRLQLTSYDWVTPGRSAAEGGECVVSRSSTLVGPAPTIALFPDRGGNVHELTALTDCAVLDVLAPPYSARAGRDCTYYALDVRRGESGTEETLHLRPVASNFSTGNAPGRMLWPGQL